mmetsp:Transcript_2182/g.5464  ORF Transcript_2182/g.5464 Transcript_2182/m.5464 type:complete len:361 (-) Transcript_2182:51-1133(-)
MSRVPSPGCDGSPPAALPGAPLSRAPGAGSLRCPRADLSLERSALYTRWSLGLTEGVVQRSAAAKCRASTKPRRPPSSVAFCEATISLSARTHASRTSAAISAPLKPAAASATAMQSTSGDSGVRRVSVDRMEARPGASGSGTYRILSSRPGRRSAGSRMSIRLVAISTLILLVASKPSSWLSSSSIVRCTSLSPPPLPLSVRAEPMLSTSSMKMMDGECSLAITNSSRTMREPSPMYFCTSSLPETRMKVQSVWCATARASSVLPVPGGPTSSAPLGILAPSSWKRLGSLRNFTNSMISVLASSQPATSLNIILFLLFLLNCATCALPTLKMPRPPPEPPPPGPARPLPPPICRRVNHT